MLFNLLLTGYPARYFLNFVDMPTDDKTPIKTNLTYLLLEQERNSADCTSTPLILFFQLLSKTYYSSFSFLIIN
jgi:hypothetical protein